MAQVRPLGCIIASALTIVAGIVLLIGSIFYATHIYYLRYYWLQIYALSVYASIIAVLTIITAIGLMYVVNREFPALTTLFSGILVFIAFLSIICVTILATGRNDLERQSYDNTLKLFLNYSDSSEIKSSKPIFERIQQSYECCGIEKATDWKNLTTDGTSTPDSCCKEMTIGCGNGSLIKQDNIYLRGCAEPLYYDFRKVYSTLIGMNVVLIIFTLISAALGIVYERYIRQQYQSM
jgi:hypothetical protein